MQSISVKELMKLPNTSIIDIRSIEKFNDNHIPSAKNIQSINLIDNPSKYLNFNQTYYLYCQKGINSVKIGNLLSKRGYHIVNVIGGYENWLLEN